MKSRKITKTAKKSGSKNIRLKSVKRPFSFSIFNFSDVEDSPEAFNIIKKIAQNAGKSAAAEARTAGLSNIFVRNNQIILSYPNGKEEVVATNLPNGNEFYVKYKPGTVFHVNKK